MPNPRAEIIQASADPAAGGEIVFVAPEDMIVHSLRFVLVTSAVVGNRIVAIQADDGTTVFFSSQANFTHAASISVPYCAHEGAILGSTNGQVTLSLPAQGLQLRKGDRLITSTTSKDAGDNYGPMALQAERV